MMEPKKVFDEYLNLCTDHFGHLQYHLQANSVLEWFGRTVRGRDKIKNFARYKLAQEYDHHFTTWKLADPFEVRPAHFETKTLQLKLADDIQNRQIDNNKYNTPIDLNRKIIELPPITNGRNFLQDIESDDDDDFKDLGIAQILDVTPPSSPTRKCLEKYSLGTEPPIKKSKISKFKDLFNSKDNYLSESEGSYVAKEFDNCITKGNEELNNSTTESSSKTYSDLNYIIAIGCLIPITSSKYHGFKHHSTGKTMVESQDSDSEIYSKNCSFREREVKLQISYRIHLSDSRIEFALIIYEHLIRKSIIRRNLLTEFTETTNEKPVKTINESKLEKKNEISNIKRKTPLKRLLRLF